VLRVAPDLPAVLFSGGPSPSLIDRIVREGARAMLAESPAEDASLAA
jgi:hypothetical protein